MSHDAKLNSTDEEKLLIFHKLLMHDAERDLDQRRETAERFAKDHFKNNKNLAPLAAEEIIYLLKLHPKVPSTKLFLQDFVSALPGALDKKHIQKLINELGSPFRDGTEKKNLLEFIDQIIAVNPELRGAVLTALDSFGSRKDSRPVVALEPSGVSTARFVNSVKRSRRALRRQPLAQLQYTRTRDIPMPSVLLEQDQSLCRQLKGGEIRTKETFDF